MDTDAVVTGIAFFNLGMIFGLPLVYYLIYELSSDRSKKE